MSEETASMTYRKGQLYALPLADLRTDPNQPRKYLDPQALEELAASIREHGVLEPILFRDDVAGQEDPDSPAPGSAPLDKTLYVVAGERRVAAAKKAGCSTVPAIFVEGNHAEIALVENLLRQDLTAVEEAEALQRLMAEQQYTQDQLAAIIGKAPSTMSEILSLNRLPQTIRDDCRNNPTVARRTLVAIAKSKQQRGMQTLYNKYKEKALTQAQIKQQARRERKTACEQALGVIGTAQTKIPTLAIEAFAPTDKEALVLALQDLKKVIEEKLTALGRS